MDPAVEQFVDHYNHHRYHESINYLTPAQVYYHQVAQILEERKQTKLRTLNKRRELYQRA